MFNPARLRIRPNGFAKRRRWRKFGRHGSAKAFFTGTISMKTHLTRLAVAAVLVVTAAIPGRAEDAAPAPAAPATAPASAAPASVPRPSIVPKPVEPAVQQTVQPAADAAPATPRQHRRYARRHYRHYAYWQPFPIYWPHLRHSHIYWSRISWFAF